MAAASAGPQLTLKGAAGRRWGPADYSSSSQAAPPAAAPTPALQSTSASTAPASRQQPARAAEKDRLAASIFGGLGVESSSSSSPTTAGGGKQRAATPPPAPPPPPMVDLLGEDYTPAPAAAAPAVPTAAAPPVPANPLDLLMDFDAAPPAAAPSAAAPVASTPAMTQPAVQTSQLDLLGDLGASPAAAPVAPSGNLLDLDLLGGSQTQTFAGGVPALSVLGTSPVAQPGQLQPSFSLLGAAGGLPAGQVGAAGHAAAFSQLPAVGGGKAMAAGPKGSGMGPSNTPTDPFKDLLS